MKKYSGLDRIPKGKAEGPVVPGCMVLEGGAFRGLYTQGALDALMLKGIMLQTTIGVSAGALSGIGYMSRQIGRAARVNLEYRHDSRYIGWRALFRAKSPLNLDFLFKDYEEIEPLDKLQFADPTRRFVVVCSNCLTGETVYFDRSNCNDLLLAVKASASMPFGTPMVEVEGQPYLDGGSSCKIPFQWALDNHFEKIVLIKTREVGFRKTVTGRRLAAKFYRKYPQFAEALDRSPSDYNKLCDEIDALEASGRMYVLAPSKPVTVSRLEGDVEKLGDLYWCGYNDAMAHAEEIRVYLNAPTPSA